MLHGLFGYIMDKRVKQNISRNDFYFVDYKVSMRWDLVPELFGLSSLSSTPLDRKGDDICREVRVTRYCLQEGLLCSLG